jgi:hypothetical protein
MWCTRYEVRGSNLDIRPTDHVFSFLHQNRFERVNFLQSDRRSMSDLFASKCRIAKTYCTTYCTAHTRVIAVVLFSQERYEWNATTQKYFVDSDFDTVAWPVVLQTIAVVLAHLLHRKQPTRIVS